MLWEYGGRVFNLDYEGKVRSFLEVILGSFKWFVVDFGKERNVSLEKRNIICLVVWKEYGIFR